MLLRRLRLPRLCRCRLTLRIGRGLCLFLSLCQKFIHRLKCPRSVIIVRVDDRNRTIRELPRRQYRMCRSPRFHAPLRHCVALRQIRQFLIRVSDINVLSCFFVDQRAEIVFIFFFDDKNSFTEPRHDRVIERKVQNNLSFVADRFHLLQSSETAAHARRHDHQDRFFFHILKLLLFTLSVRRRFAASLIFAV